MTTHDAVNPGVALVQRLVLLVVVIGVIALLASALVLPGAVAADRAVETVKNTVLDVPPLPPTLERPPENSVVLAADGTELAELHDVENRILVSLDDIPQAMQNAVIATEDADFWTHNGVNHQAIVRAFLTNLRSGDIEQGASTITQQYVRNVPNLDISAEQTYDRKIKEALWAIELEQRLPKHEILERYLNTAYFGEGVYGVGTAARHYFSKHVSQLTLEESAMLAGLIRAPERNNPVDDPEAARTRRDIVLDQMAAQGFITEEQAADAQARAIALDLPDDTGPVEPFFVDWVKRILYDETVDLQPDVQAALGDTKKERQQRLFTGGLVVHTTLDRTFQDTAERTIEQYLTDPIEDPLAALVTVKPQTGAVMSMAVGPKQYGECPEGEEPCEVTKFNPAIPRLGELSGRQPGSSFKPFVITSALANGFSPGWSTETTSGQEIEGCEKSPGVPYEVNNYAGGGGGFMDMYEAVKRSNNVYHAKLTEAVGVANVLDTARTLGLEHIPNADNFGPVSCSVGLGAAQVFPLEMASAYGTLANQGIHCEPFAISRIEDRDGNLIYQHTEDCEQVIDRGIVARVTDIIQGPPSPGGTAGYVRGQLGRPVAGKTGTTQDWKDAWFMGFVPQFSTAAWVGYETPKSMFGVEANGITYARVTGGSIPGHMWADYMEQVLEGVPVEDFASPPPVPTTRVPDVVGMSEEAAIETLEARDFRVEVETVTSHVAAGTVAEQTPPGGTSQWVGSVVVIGISDGEGAPPLVTVPDVLGMTEGQAADTIRGAGLSVEVVATSTTNPAEDGIVLRQSPAPGQELEPGSRVVIGVGRLDRGGGDGGGGDGGGGDGGGGGGGGDGGGNGGGDGGGNGGGDGGGNGSGDGGGNGGGDGGGNGGGEPSPTPSPTQTSTQGSGGGGDSAPSSEPAASGDGD